MRMEQNMNDLMPIIMSKGYYKKTALLKGVYKTIA